jgi:hypothetical protein
MAATTTVQPWTTGEDVGAPCNEGVDPTLLTNCIQFASEVLYNFTGRRWPGEQTDTIRPCGIRTNIMWGRPFESLSSTPNLGWCGCNRPRECGCHHLSEIRLPGYPVVGVDHVKIDGEEVDPSWYRLDDHRWLVWIGDDDSGRTAWPCCQRLDLADSEPDTFSVAYTFGTTPDQGGVMACASLACELALAFGGGLEGDKKCRLPRRVTTIARQGVTIAVLDPLTLFKEGQTGLAEVDMWIASKMVGAKTRRASVSRIGQGRRSRRTGV